MPRTYASDIDLSPHVLKHMDPRRRKEWLERAADAAQRRGRMSSEESAVLRKRIRQLRVEFRRETRKWRRDTNARLAAAARARAD